MFHSFHIQPKTRCGTPNHTWKRLHVGYAIFVRLSIIYCIECVCWDDDSDDVRNPSAQNMLSKDGSRFEKGTKPCTKDRLSHCRQFYEEFKHINAMVANRHITRTKYPWAAIAIYCANGAVETVGSWQFAQLALKVACINIGKFHMSYLDSNQVTRMETDNFYWNQPNEGSTNRSDLNCSYPSHCVQGIAAETCKSS